MFRESCTPSRQFGCTAPSALRNAHPWHIPAPRKVRQDCTPCWQPWPIHRTPELYHLFQGILYPLDTIRTRLAVCKHNSYNGIFHAASRIWAEEGVTGFYRGITPSMIGILPYAGVDIMVGAGCGGARGRHVQQHAANAGAEPFCRLKGCSMAIYRDHTQRYQIESELTTSACCKDAGFAVSACQRTHSWAGPKVTPPHPESHSHLALSGV